jgi:hypothetical protein
MGSRRTTFPLSGASRVAVGDIDAALAAETVAGFGDRGLAAYLDVTSPESFQGFLEAAESRRGLAASSWCVLRPGWGARRVGVGVGR